MYKYSLEPIPDTINYLITERNDDGTIKSFVFCSNEVILEELEKREWNDKRRKWTILLALKLLLPVEME